jgi:hypothetical protein
VDKAAHRRQAFAVDRRVALPLHHVAVTLWGRPIVAGEVATMLATDSRAPVPSSTSDRRASFSKFPATVDALYKLMAIVLQSSPSIPGHRLPHRETRAPTPTLNRPPELTNFKLPPNWSAAPRRTASPPPAPFRSVPVPCLFVLALSQLCDAYRTLNLHGVALDRREHLHLSAMLSVTVARAH